MIKQLYISLVFILSLYTGAVFPKYLIWDLGGMFFNPDKFSMAFNVGVGNFILYPITTGKSPYELKTILYDVLNQVDTCYLEKYNLPPATRKDKVLPLILRSWLASIDTNADLLMKINQKIDELDCKKYFYNSIEKQLIKGIIRVILDPCTFAYYIRPEKAALRILKECYDKNHTMYVLSNWDKESFEYLYYSSRGQKVFKYFKKENMVISGNIKMIKPGKEIFWYTLRKYNLNPQECVFIDDQLTNVKVARECGLTGIHLKNGNYKQLYADLKNLGVI